MKKGFTLLELLAVLVVLAIVSLITIPIVLTSINVSKTNGLLRSADNLVKTAELKYVETVLQGYHSTYEEGELTSGEELIFNGKIPDYATINVNNAGDVSLALWDNELNICLFKGYNDDSSVIQAASDFIECMSFAGTTIVLTYPQVIDSNPGIIFGNTETEDYANQTNAYINSVEDLAQLSNLAKTNSFSGKTVYINTNLDINNNKSYINSSTLVFGDINENGTVEPLKTELTTEKGMYPIGTNSRIFYGTVVGQYKIIKNVLINRPDMSYVGFFGRTLSSISKLKLDSIKVTGADYVGGLIGYDGPTSGRKTSAITIDNGIINGNNYVGGLIGYTDYYGNVIMSMVKADVTGNNYVGGVIGQLYGKSFSGSSIRDLLYEGNIVGNDYVGGITGLNTATYTTATRMLNLGGSITATTNFGRITGINAVQSSGSNKNTLVNGIAISSLTDTSNNGIDILTNVDGNIKDINVLDSLEIDTVIGGDASSDQLYFNYVDNKIAIVDSTLVFDLAGSGNDLDPYLVETEDDLLQVSFYNSAYYKLVNDLNFNERNNYVITNSTSIFTGTFDGNNHKISNMKIHGVQKVGLFGTVRGTIKNLIIENANILGTIHVGTVSGYATGTASSLKNIKIINSEVFGHNYVGGLVGYNYGGLITSNEVEADVSGNDYVGGVVGYGFGSLGSGMNARLYDATFKGDVVGNNYVSGILAGTTSTHTTTSGIINLGGNITGNTNVVRTGATDSASNSNVLVNGATVTSESSGNGISIPNDYISNLALFESLGIDTVIGGDNNSDGYYYDYTNSELGFKEANLIFDLVGSGTIGDPYLIENEDDMIKISLNKTAYYKLNNDIDYNNKNSYMYSSSKNTFTGYFDGNGKTISNLTIKGNDMVGLFGKVSSTGTISNLNFDNIQVYGRNHIGSVVGYIEGSSRTIEGINVKNSNVYGNSYVGGIGGYNYYGLIQNTMFQGDVTGTGSYVGGISGYNYGYTASGTGRVYYSIAKGNVSGNSNVAGIVGGSVSSRSAVTGNVLLEGNITGTTASRITNSAATKTNNIANLNSLVNGVTVTSTSLTSYDGQDKTIEQLQLQATYTAIGFNFTDTTTGVYIWKISGNNIWVEKN